jgi:hypothetical protein
MVDGQIRQHRGIVLVVPLAVRLIVLKIKFQKRLLGFKITQLLKLKEKLQLVLK